MSLHGPRSLTRLDSGTHRVRPQGEPGRVCSAPGCATRLSIYNPAEFCALHADDPPVGDDTEQQQAV